jgi:conjugative transfer signal peptidase TraF
MIGVRKTIGGFGRLRHSPAMMWIAVFAAVPLLFTLMGMAGYRVNLTPSEPIGLWRIVALDRPAAVGDLVFVCPPQTGLMQTARDRGYLRGGLCPGGYAPLIKIIVATEGASLTIGRAVAIDGRTLAGSVLKTSDGEGRSLAAFTGGIVPTGEIFVHSPFPASFDSRYFGPIPTAGILGLATEVLTYAP